MDLLAFIRTADPTKVRVAERQRAEDEPRVLESTVRRVVPLLPIALARASSELEASVDRLFDEGASRDGQDADVQPVAVTTNTIVDDVAPLQPRRQKKRKTDVADAGGPSHPPKKLREDFGALGGISTADKSMAAVQSLFSEAMLEAEARGEPVPTFPFVTSSLSATPEREDRSPADSVTGPNLLTIGAPQRFVISSDSSYYSGANIAEAEVDSIIRSSAPAIATVTTVTAAIDTEATATRAPYFFIGGIRTVVDPNSNLQKVYVPRWSVTNGFGLDDNRICREMLDESAPPKFFSFIHEMDHDQLFTEFNVGAARQISLNAEVRMCVEYNIREKRKLRAVVDEQAELLKTKDGEIESLKAQLLLKEAEAAEAIRLRAEFFKFESAEQSLRGEVGFLRDQNTALERENNELNVKVTDLSAFVKVREQEVADLDAQVTAVKLQNDNLVGQGFKIKLLPMRVLSVNLRNEKLEEWLLTYGMELAVAKCMNSTEYLSALGAEISKAVEKGMQEGLSAGITHGAEGRQLADVAAYNSSTEADYLSALHHLQSVNFSLIAELKSNKDASVDTIMNLLRLDDVLAEILGLTESQPHVDQLMNTALEREKIELNVKVTDLSASVKVREQEVADLDAQVTAVKLQNDNLVGQVNELEISSAGLQEKVTAYEGFVSQLEEFLDEKLEEINEKFDKLCVDFVKMALHLEEKFYPHLLTTISGCRWLLTYGMELAVAKCLNFTEYLSALGAAISKAVEKGMQEGLSIGITYGAEGRQLADVAAYNPSAEADYLSALQHLQSVNFSLIAELKSNKDASVDTIMNLLRLDDVLAEILGLTESQPHVDQLMVPIHHSPDQRVVGASALSFSLEVSNSWVKKMRENIANHVSALRGVFVPLFEPLSATALEGMEGTSGSTPDVAATLSRTSVSTSTTPPISTDDYEVAYAESQGGARVDEETAADDDMNLFVSNVDLNISE
nr:hypothetical protein [Tanacetum cinerariifolium]